MTNLLRFDFNDRDGIFEVVENGDWVRATDYDALAAKLATPLDDPRVKALVDAAKAAEAVLSQYYVGNRAIAKRKLRKALSALEENK
jgi:glycosyltransferase involved in cell wall biosynthesis